MSRIAVSWLYGIKGDLNEASLSLGLVVCILIVFRHCCLGFYVGTWL